MEHEGKKTERKTVKHGRKQTWRTTTDDRKKREKRKD